MRWLAPSALVVLAALAPTRDADACAAIGRRGPVRIDGEEALIIWKPETRTEHFIRTAHFSPTDEDFGFLVPTPSRPQLAEVDDGVFARLFEIYRAPTRALRIGGGGGALRSRSTSAAPPVRVLERRTVAGLDAAVLAASDAGALDGWLAEHGYPSGPALRSWLDRYVTERWIVTAFRVDPSAQRGRGFATSAVRMTFQTDRPFFPYSEPQHAEAGPSRPFRVSVVAPTPMRATIDGQPWSARVGYGNRPGRRLVQALRRAAPAGSVDARSYLTVFDEPRSVRGPHDLFFESDPDAARVRSRIRTQIVAGTRARPAARR